MVQIGGKPCHTLLDTGSMADFMSTMLVDQLRLKWEVLVKPLPVQLVVHGSCSKINCSITADFEYQDIACKQWFNVVNLDNYDLILGTPFLFQYQVVLAWNPTHMSIGSTTSLDVQGEDVAIVASAVVDIFKDELKKLHEELWQDTADLCQDGACAALPLLWDVNHSILLIDKLKLYSWQLSKCPEVLLSQWQEKKAAYLESSHWQLALGMNASPMLMIKKPPCDNSIVQLWMVMDKQEQNANTHKLTVLLPDIEGILQNVVKHKYHSIIDSKDAYEQIRVVPEHIPQTLFMTPDGMMVSLVLQQGNINGPTTYQAVMNHIFTPYIGVFMDVYLDDIVIYSNTIEDHMWHIQLVFDVLHCEKFFLGADKMNFFTQKLKLLRHILDEKGIAMDPHKVNSVIN